MANLYDFRTLCHSDGLNVSNLDIAISINVGGKELKFISAGKDAKQVFGKAIVRQVCKKILLYV